jgi:hypothetical protein
MHAELPAPVTSWLYQSKPMTPSLAHVTNPLYPETERAALSFTVIHTFYTKQPLYHTQTSHAILFIRTSRGRGQSSIQ